jgi:hypothetical protein
VQEELGISESSEQHSDEDMSDEQTAGSAERALTGKQAGSSGRWYLRLSLTLQTSTWDLLEPFCLHSVWSSG